VVQFAADRAEARLNITQAFAVSELSEAHRQKLVPARETLLLVITVIPTYTLLKLVPGKMLHELGENSLAKVHSSLSTWPKEAEITLQALAQSEKAEIEKSRKPT
jgi:hypothetical protein